MLDYDDVLSQLKQVAVGLYQRNRTLRDGETWDGTSREPEPVEVTTIELDDLDSFTFIQLSAELEELHDLPLLRNIAAFDGKTFSDLARFVIECAQSAGRLP